MTRIPHRDSAAAPGSRPGHACLTALGALLALSAAAWPLTASAYRPFNGTDASVAPRGELEVEFGPLGYLVQGPNRTLVAPSLVLNWGFAKGWEAVLEGRHFVELGSDIHEPRLRVEDTALSLKTVLHDGSLQGKTGVSIATELAVLLPTVNGDTGTGAEWALIVSRRWRPVTVHVTGAAAWTRADTPAVFGGVIVEGHDEWTLRPVAEVFAEREGDTPATISGLVGTIWRATDALSFDAGLRRAEAGGVSTTEIRVGLTWGFGVGFPR